MHADLCDNCKAAAPADEPFAKDGWVKVGKFVRHEQGHGGSLPPGIPLPPEGHPMREILEQIAGQAGGKPHTCPGDQQWELCSDKCAELFIGNGYKPNVEGLFAAIDSLSPQDFVDAAAPPPDPEG